MNKAFNVQRNFRHDDSCGHTIVVLELLEEQMRSSLDTDSGTCALEELDAVEGTLNCEALLGSGKAVRLNLLFEPHVQIGEWS